MRHTFSITAGVAVVCGLLAVILYIESASSPGEQSVRSHACLLCHPGLFDRPLPGVAEQYTPGTPLRPGLTQAIRNAHAFVSAEEAARITEYALPRQQLALALARRGDEAQALYLAKCAACHGSRGEGQDDRYPPLRDSEWLTAEPSRLPEILHQGLQGPITVRGKEWNATMLPPGVAPGEETHSLIRYLRREFSCKQHSEL